jgi:hypothetical protein
VRRLSALDIGVEEVGHMSHRRGFGCVVLCVLVVCGCHGNDRGLRPVRGGTAGVGGSTPGVPEGIPGYGGTGGSPSGTGGVMADGATAPGDGSLAPTDGGGDVTAPIALPVPGNPTGQCAAPAEAMAEDVSSPRTVVGTGTPASCTSDAFVNAVALGGVITFNCGPAPVTITLTRTAKIFNDTGPKIVIDGGGKVTLSGGGKVRILYLDTCDVAQRWTTDHCDDQDHPQLTVQNLTFIDGSAKGQGPRGGGAILASGGRLKVVSSRFAGNVCEEAGPITGGGAIHAYGQFQGKPVYVVNSTFGGRDGLGNACSNGGALSGFGVSYSIFNSVFTDNRATGTGAIPARRGTPGGGSGGAIYTDVGSPALSLCGSQVLNNSANEGGGAIFFNSDNGTLSIKDSQLSHNVSKAMEATSLPGILVIGRDPQVTNSKIE